MVAVRADSKSGGGATNGWHTMTTAAGGVDTDGSRPASCTAIGPAARLLVHRQIVPSVLLLVFAAGSLKGLELDPDGVRAGNGHRPPKMHRVHIAVIDPERGEVFDPAQQFSMSWDSQAE
jgi:hypothetical protein